MRAVARHGRPYVQLRRTRVCHHRWIHMRPSHATPTPSARRALWPRPWLQRRALAPLTSRSGRLWPGRRATPHTWPAGPPSCPVGAAAGVGGGRESVQGFGREASPKAKSAPRGGGNRLQERHVCRSDVAQICLHGRTSAMARPSASPMPSQEGRMRRVWVHAKIQGMARRLATDACGAAARHRGARGGRWNVTRAAKVRGSDAWAEHVLCVCVGGGGSSDVLRPQQVALAS